MSRLGVGLQEAGDEGAILRALESGLRELRLLPFVGRLDPDSQAVRIFAPGVELGGRSPGTREPLGQLVSVGASPLLGRMIRSRETVYSRRAAAEVGPILPPTPHTAGELFSSGRAWSAAIGAPMVAHGRMCGLLLVLGDEIDEALGPAFRALAAHLAVALENAALLRQLKQALLREHAAARELRRLEGLVAELAAEREPQAVQRLVVLAAAEALSAERVGLVLAGQQEPVLILAASVGLGATFSQALDGLKLGAGDGALARAVDEGVAVVVEDTRSEPAWQSLLTASEEAGIRSAWAVPLVSRQGERFGALVVFGERPGRPDAEQLELAERYALHAALAIASSRHQQRETQRARSEALAELARSIPHEVGQPLAIVSGYAELISEGLLEGEKLRDACREIVEASGNLAEIVQRLERISTYATKEYGPGRTVIDLDRAADDDPTV